MGCGTALLVLGDAPTVTGTPRSGVAGGRSGNAPTVVGGEDAAAKLPLCDAGRRAVESPAVAGGRCGPAPSVVAGESTAVKLPLCEAELGAFASRSAARSLRAGAAVAAALELGDGGAGGRNAEEPIVVGGDGTASKLPVGRGALSGGGRVGGVGRDGIVGAGRDAVVVRATNGGGFTIGVAIGVGTRGVVGDFGRGTFAGSGTTGFPVPRGNCVV